VGDFGLRHYRHPWDMTLESFLGDFPTDSEDLNERERIYRLTVMSAAASWIRRGAVAAEGNPCFLLTSIRGRLDDVALVRVSPDGSAPEPVGGYVEEFLWIEPSFRGMGLAAELVLAKADRVGSPVNAVHYTPAGRAAHAAAHRLSVRRALKSGFKVPVAVLEENRT
jgi:GNAT superfamily N-acetyltransferase